jgi:hypothetical protein
MINQNDMRKSFNVAETLDIFWLYLYDSNGGLLPLYLRHTEVFIGNGLTSVCPPFPSYRFFLRWILL